MNAKTILASLHAVFLALLLSSCHEPVPAGGSGTEILFTGRTYPEATTKTSYSGVINNANLERINWEPGDDLTLVSPSARVYTNTSVQPWVLGHNQGSGTWSKVSYQLQNGTIQTDQTDAARSLMRMVPKEATGLQWEDPGTYYIYGVYPSESSSDATRPTISWSGTGGGQGNITATIPSSQGYASSAKEDLASPTPTGIKHITRIAPDMSKAYMYAGLKKDIVAGDKIEAALDFYPMFTAFEFGVKALPDPETGNAVKIDIDWFELVSESCALSGAFTSVVTLGHNCNQPSGSKAVYTTPAYAAANGKVRLEMPRQEGTSNTAVTVSSEDSLVFTVFVLPKGIAYKSGTPSLGDLPGESTITDLTVRFRIKKQGTNQQWTGRSLALKPKVKTNLNPGITLSANDFVEFPAGKKVRINGLQLPSQQDPWSFSVSATDLEEEISDVAVTPVAVQKWEYVTPELALDEHYFSVIYDGVATSATANDPAVSAKISLDTNDEKNLPFSVITDMGFTVTVSDGAGSCSQSGEASFSVVTTTDAPVKVQANTTLRGASQPSRFTEKAFSVSAGRQVYFSPGNLQYRAYENGVAVNRWRFADHQWDFVGDAVYGTVSENNIKSDNTKISSSYSGWIDLFGWGTSGVNYRGEGTHHFQPWATASSPQSEVSMEYGPKYGSVGVEENLSLSESSDWGVNPIYSGSTVIPGKTYSSLTSQEWDYVTKGRLRPTGTFSFIKAALQLGDPRIFTITFTAKADPRYSVTYTVEQPYQLYGLILFPDEFKTENAILAAEYESNPSLDVYYETWTSVKEEDWLRLEAAGCVFLPAGGTRFGVLMSTDSYEHQWQPSSVPKDSKGRYWSSSTGSAATAYRLYFDYRGLNASSNTSNANNRCYGFSVRLVRDAVPAGTSAGTSSYVVGGNPFE